MYEDDVTPTLFFLYVNIYNIVFSEKNQIPEFLPTWIFLASVLPKLGDFEAGPGFDA